MISQYNFSYHTTHRVTSHHPLFATICTDELFDLELCLVYTHHELSLRFEQRRDISLRELGPYLYPANVTAWVRAVGRGLNVDPAECHFHHICYALSMHAPGNLYSCFRMHQHPLILHSIMQS